MKRKLIVTLLCIVVVLVITAVCLFVFNPFGWRSQINGNDTPTEFALQIEGYTEVAADGIGKLDESVELCSVGKYTGNFVEDGSDKPVTDVLAIVVKNTSDSWLEYFQVSLFSAEKTAYFECTALPANSYALVLEANGMLYSADEALGSPKCDSPAVITNAVMDFSGEFALYPSDGVINVENISGTDIAGDIYVYYKNVLGDVYLGGIAYRVRIEGGMSAGQIAQRMEPHYSLDNSVILFMTYDK